MVKPVKELANLLVTGAARRRRVSRRCSEPNASLKQSRPAPLMAQASFSPGSRAHLLPPTPPDRSWLDKLQRPPISIPGHSLTTHFIAQLIVRTKMKVVVICKLKAGGFNFMDD